MVNEIVIIRIVSAILFFIAFIISHMIHSKTEYRTDIWLLVSTVLLIAGIESVANVFEWAGIVPKMADIFGEYLSIMFSFVWFYIAFVFTSKESK